MAGKKQPNFDQGILPGMDAQTNWVMPTELPDLSRETEIAIDTETCDPGLKKGIGPGFYMFEKSNLNTGYIAGISAAWRDQSIYIPLRHERRKYFDHDLVQRWIRSLAKQDHTRFIFHNFAYDWGWLNAEFDIKPPLLLDDTGAMASMIDENRPDYSLDGLCQWQGLPGKDETGLREAMALRRVPANQVKSMLFELPPHHVGPYAEQDAASTLTLAHQLRPLLSEENLDFAYQVERDLMPITLSMKQRGIRIDAIRTNRLIKEIKGRCDQELVKLSEKIEERVTINELRRSRWLEASFQKMNLWYPRTQKSETYADGQASFEKNFMATHEHWFPRTCHKIKHQYDLADKFLEKFILGYAYKGRVYPSVNQFRSETGGARSHRFSYADPPLQQMPSRDDEWAPLIRSCFIPEEGEVWGSIDYRQQEYRLIVFTAELQGCTGAKKAADMYRSNRDTDFHNYVSEITRLPRRRAKDVNFAKSYGAGVAKFGLMTGMSEAEAKATMLQYDTELPFVKEVADWYSRYANRYGYIEMLDGARNHFNLWEPMYRDWDKELEYKKQYGAAGVMPCHMEDMQLRVRDITHPWSGERVKRAFTHKAFNRMIQGTAARQVKLAMVQVYHAGYPPLLQIHDELGFSFANPENIAICAKIMEEAMPQITIPMLTDTKIGKSWGELKK
jgi:DNA polymerase I-like protein with 3'-5' exonuclease and polymerase domains